MSTDKLPRLFALKPKGVKSKKMTPPEKLAKVKAVKGGQAPMPAMAAQRIGGKARI